MMAIKSVVWYNINACESLFALIKRVPNMKQNKIYNTAIYCRLSLVLLLGY